MNITFAFIIGAVLWLPTLLALDGAGLGSPMRGSELLPVLSPVIFVAIPVSIRSFARSSPGAIWWLALAPLLMALGFIGAQLLREAIFRKDYSPRGDLICNTSVALLWLASGAIYFVLSRRAASQNVESDA